MLNGLSLLEILKDVSMTAFSPGGCFSIERLLYQDIRPHCGDVKLSNFHNVWFLGCCAASNLAFIADILCLLVHALYHHSSYSFLPETSFGFRFLPFPWEALTSSIFTIWYYILIWAAEGISAFNVALETSGCRACPIGWDCNVSSVFQIKKIDCTTTGWFYAFVTGTLKSP